MSKENLIYYLRNILSLLAIELYTMDFEVLKDLAKTITRNKVKNIEVLGNFGKAPSKVDLFYNAIISDKFKTEKELVRHFFKSYDTKNPGYLKLKKKLVHQLINMAFFVDVNQPAFNERAKAYFTSHRDFSAAVVLISRNAGKSGIYILQLVLEQAIKYEFTDLAADASKLLRKNFARNAGDPEKNQYYTRIHQLYESKRRHETLAMDYHETLVSYYLTKRSPNEEIHRRATLYFEELLPITELVDTSTFYYYTFNIGIIKYISLNDLENTLKLCDQAQKVLESRKNSNRDYLAILAMQKMACYTQMKIKDDSLIKNLLNYCLDFAEVGRFNWFRAYEVYFYHCTYCGNYEEALGIYKITSHGNRFNILEGSFHDNWLLLGGYLHLLAKLGVLDPLQVNEIVGPFRYSKFFNEIEILKKDKEGMNIPLIFLPVLMQLSQKPSERTKDIPIEALEKYRQRWLANDMNRRSNSFLKLLIAFSQKDFASASADKKIKKELDILKSETPQVAGQNFAVEIIPYETLWELLIARHNFS